MLIIFRGIAETISLFASYSRETIKAVLCPTG